MRVEIDQSGKFEQLNTHTVIACANDENATIRLTASIKRRLVKQLRESIIPRKDFFAIIFALLVFLLLGELGELPRMIIIDEEYSGKERVIRETLRKLLIRKTKGKWQGFIRFKQIGKSSPAHCLAWRIRRKKIKTGVKSITEREVLHWWK